MVGSVRKQVEAEIIRVIADAEADGRDGVTAAQKAFPGTPETVLWGCWSQWDSDQTSAWWRSVEDTIDGEIIQRALRSADN